MAGTGKIFLRRDEFESFTMRLEKRLQSLRMLALGSGGVTSSTAGEALILDQTTPQTIVNGIPFLDQEYDAFSDLKQFVNKGYVDWAVTAIGAAYYMTDDTDGDTGYKICSLTPSAGSETYVEASGVTDGQLLGTWISDVGEAPAKLLRGIYDWFIFAEKVSGTKTLRLYWELYERKTDTSTGVKTSHIVPLVLDSDYTPDTGSRIVGKFYASVTGSGNDPTVRLYYQGISGSRWEIPTSTEVLNNIYIKRDEIGIDDDDILQVDQASGLTAGNLVRATSSGLESRTDAEILAQLSGKASSAFDWNGQNLTGVDDIIQNDIGFYFIPSWFIKRGLTYIPFILPNSDGWTISTSGSAVVSVEFKIDMHTGTTTDSIARIYSGGFARGFISGITDRYFSVIAQSGASGLGDAILFLGISNSSSTITDTTRMIGFKVSGGTIYAHVADGTNSTNVSTGVTWTDAWRHHSLSFVLDDTEIKFYIDGSLEATISTNLPTDMYNGRIVYQIQNKVATNKNIVIRSAWLIT